MNLFKFLIITVSFSLSIINNLFGQISTKLGGDNLKTIQLCESLQGKSFSSNMQAEKQLEKILNVVGLKKNFVLTPCDKINNAIAITVFGTRHIFYDPNFMKMLSQNTSDWTNLFILAHEVGHHLNGHTLDAVLYVKTDLEPPALFKSRKQELEADEFAAFVLAKLGCDLDNILKSISSLSDNDDTYSRHPKRSKRSEAIKKGFNRGKNVIVRTSRKTKTLKNTTRVEENNALYDYSIIKVESRDSIVNKFSKSGLLLKQEIYQLCKRKSKINLTTKEQFYEPFSEWKKRCPNKWILAKETEFFNQDWERGIKISAELFTDEKKIKIRVKCKSYLENDEQRSKYYLLEESTRFCYSNRLFLYNSIINNEFVHTNQFFLEGEKILYYESGAVYSYAYYNKNSVTNKITYYWESGQIKKIENIYSLMPNYAPDILEEEFRPYDGQLDKWYYKNGVEVMSYIPNGYYDENETGSIFYDNGQLFCDYRVIPSDNLSDLIRNEKQNYELNLDEISVWDIPAEFNDFEFSKIHTNRIYHRNGKVFADIKFDNQFGAIFKQCFDKNGHKINCADYSTSIFAHIVNLIETSEIKKKKKKF